MLEELARSGCYTQCEQAAHVTLVHLKGKKKPVNEFEDFFKWSDQFHVWDGGSVKRMVSSKPDSPYRKAWQWFNAQGEELCKAYVAQRFGGDIKAAMRAAGSFDNFFYGFREYYSERKAVYMADIDKQLIQQNTQLTRSGKLPQSHGGVANLLKVLTRTMTLQGSSIQTIAKVQYAVCIQAGIFIPEEFITDVLVASNIMDEGKEAKQ